ncbi:uncharacterized protein TOT_010001267 [Theileria orientalis strain Shintoku]|uniref:Uncharacterized protein n=1 Tax=Theileria orientalis strain Shintoku TaxID=869250 RepID=J4CC99_THEOR|nr:uncharacterized protein TOT_010001267 [Theileria orientalis strain Shintoku]PVC50098.1 hypothetical protein MACL_00002536 [Theileria orientalis]BAM39022.1 uncharacterized protein TOT_010001267 [Theileria orientalis strain Shintoku]|eukprot:XP_009689323.1 uncharacterized protein TOT_010001267 [Theileria orientalis strain Shintoku]
MSEDNTDSCYELAGSEDGEFAYSLFDDFKSTDAFEVYDYMEQKYGFKYNLLGTSTLHRVALLKYLQEKKDANKDVLEAYNTLKNNKNLVLDNFENYVKPPFKNEKLIWGFMESSDSEAEGSVLSNYVPNYPKKEELDRKNDKNGEDT